MKTDVTIIGAGVVGLAVAAELVDSKRTVLVVERNETFGRETSSRNSEVIHAGIYHPSDSLKARLCVEGKHLLYSACEKYGIPHRRIGKLIVATTPDEEAVVYDYYNRAAANNVRRAGQVITRSLSAATIAFCRVEYAETG